ncbi:hypothetical protein ACHAPT_005269 [Fusarium lateritium]
MTLEHADTNPEFGIDDVKAFLRHSAASRAPDDQGDSGLSVRLSDVKAARDKFVDSKSKQKPAPRRKSTEAQKTPDLAPDDEDCEDEQAEPRGKTKTATQKDAKARQRVEQVKGTDNEDDLGDDDHDHQAELEKPAPTKHQLPVMTPKPPQAESSSRAATNTSPDARVMPASTPIPAESPNVRKRERTVTPAGICSAKRARHEDDATLQDSNATHSKLMQSMPGFLQSLSDHIQAVEGHHFKMGQEFSDMSKSLKLRIDPHRKELERHKSAQTNIAAIQKNISVLREEEQKLKECRKTLEDAKETWVQISEEKFQALEGAHREKHTLNVTKLYHANYDLEEAEKELKEAEKAALPAMTLIRESQPKLRELSMTGNQLNKLVMHLGILRSLVAIGTPAIDALDQTLSARGISLKAVVQEIGERGPPISAEGGSGQPSAEPTA